jgi:hypothetical protein
MDNDETVASAPLTTPEEAKAFLAEMRKQTKEHEDIHKPPSHISTADGMDAWFSQQKQREKELRKRRQEAEALLRGYRGTMDESAMNAQKNNSRRSSYGSVASYGNHAVASESTPQQPHPIKSESLDDPRSFSAWKRGVSTGQEGDVLFPLSEETKEGEEKENPLAVKGGINITETSVSDAGCLLTEADQGKDPVVEAKDSAEREEPEETIWRDFISSEPGATFPPEAGRYHLVSRRCRRRVELNPIGTHMHSFG